MGEKPVAGLVAALIIAPMVACCMAPVIMVSIFTGAASRMGGVDPTTAIVVGLALAIGFVALRHRRKHSSASAKTPSLEVR